MEDLKLTLITLLQEASERLERAQIPVAMLAPLTQLARQVEEPCVLAVVGRVKAGKSTFLNALLGADLARVGCTETTATVTWFRYGQPHDPARPVRCYWRGGQATDETPAFLAGLQGHDVETLRRADGLDRVEYRLPHPYLREVTLIDTPGTAAVVTEHQQRTADFLRLRDRNEQQTRRLAGEADAIIYLVGPVARGTDQDFLTEFALAHGGHSRALNALGVLAKVDLQPELLECRHELAARIAVQFREELNTVLPVSGGLRRVLDQLLENDAAGLRHFAVTVRRVPLQRWPKLLDSEELYRELELPDCPVSPEERTHLLGDCPWGVFTTIVRALLEGTSDVEAAATRLESIAGFGPLRQVLEHHFLRRGRFLRCHRIVRDARQVLRALRCGWVARLAEQEQDDQQRWQRFQRFVRLARGDAKVAAELEDFLERRLARSSASALAQTVDELERCLSRLFHQLEHYHADFVALQRLEAWAALFARNELDELRALLGQYGLETQQRLRSEQRELGQLAERQTWWRQVSEYDGRLERRQLAARAVVRYGLLLEELLATVDSR